MLRFLLMSKPDIDKEFALLMEEGFFLICDLSFLPRYSEISLNKRKHFWILAIITLPLLLLEQS